MTPLVLSLCAMLLLTVAVRPVVRERTRRRDTGANQAVDLREALLTRSDGGASPVADATSRRGAAMDWGVGNGLATLVAMEDGTVSLYLKPGGGLLGAGGYGEVASAAERFRAAVQDVRGRMTATRSFPAPGRDAMVFYLLTDTGTLSSGIVAGNAVRVATHVLAPASDAAQALLAAIRRVHPE